MSTIPFDIFIANPDPLDLSPDDRERTQMPRYDSMWYTLADYLQPNSTLSLENAIDQIAQHFREDWFDTNPMSYIPIELAEQIPYDHPSHKKLAEFILAWYHSDKWLVGIEDGRERQRAKFIWIDHYGIFFYDSRYTPDTRFEAREIDGLPDDPLRWANYCAFDANEIGPSREKFDTRFAKYALDDALKVDPMATVEVRDAWVIGAAQYIIYQAPAIFDEVLLHQQRQTERMGVVNSLIRWITCDRQPKFDEEAKFGVKDWQSWKSMFREAAIDEAHGKTCQDVAQKAADLMALQEKVGQEEVSARLYIR